MFILNRFTPRQFQTDAYYQINTLLNASRHPVFVSSTGTGKTKTATWIIEARVSLGYRVFILCPQTEIFAQWLTELSSFGLNPGYINDEGVKGRNRMVYVCMPLSLMNIIHSIPESIYPDEIITDECHHSAAATWEGIYIFFPQARRLGLTATPKRTDGKGLDHIYTDIVQTITMKDAIAQGFLAQPLMIVPERYFSEFTVPDPDSKKGLDEQVEKLGKTEIVGDVIKNYGEIFAGLPVLVACATFEHAKMMTDSFRSAGWNFEHIHSVLNERGRAGMLRDIKSGKLNGLCTVGIGIEGLDIPGLYGLIWLRRTRSITIYLQFIGRCLRPMDGKKYGIILDPVGNLFIHGFPEADRIWALEGTGNNDTPNDSPATMRICPFCSVANAINNAMCHFCNADLIIDGEMVKASSRNFPAMVDGELIAVQSNGQAESLKERSEKVRAESAARMEAESIEKETVPIALTKDARIGILKEGLFSAAHRRPLFNEAIQNLKGV